MKKSMLTMAIVINLYRGTAYTSEYPSNTRKLMTDAVVCHTYQAASRFLYLLKQGDEIAATKFLKTSKQCFSLKAGAIFDYLKAGEVVCRLGSGAVCRLDGIYYTTEQLFGVTQLVEPIATIRLRGEPDLLYTPTHYLKDNQKLN